MSSSLARSPWQVVLASSTTIVLAVSYSIFALLMISQAGDRVGADAHLSQFQAVASFDEIGSGADIHEWFALAATVFGVVATALFLLGVLLWQGVARPGVRLIATITTVISFVGALVPLLSGLGAENAVPVESLLVIVFVNLVAAIGCLLLWAPAVRVWIQEPISN